MGIAGDIALIVFVALFCALAAQRMGFPLLLGYIVAGIVVGPNTIGPTVESAHDIEILADIGVALLLFTVGLEFPVEKLKPVKNIALLGAPIQMALVTLMGLGLGKLMGWSTTQSIWFGALISISSTMVVLNVLMSRGLMGTLSSKAMLGILVIQDIVVIPLMILLPELDNLGEGAAKLLTALAVATVFVLSMFFFGTKILPWLLARAARWNSRELFVITVLGLGLGVGYLTYLTGLSFAFGAFLAGLVLSRSEHAHDALTDMIPLREVFSLLFFASVGMLISPSFLWANLGRIAFLVLAVLLGKGVILAVTTRLFGYRKIIPLAVALSMFQVGEFAFVLARVGQGSGALTEQVYFTVISVAVITMALTPFSSKPAYSLYRWWSARQGIETEIQVEGAATARGRIVVVEYRLIGEFVAQLLKEIHHPPLVLDNDPQRCAKAKESGFDTICAELTDEVFEQTELKFASVVLLCTLDRFTSEKMSKLYQSSEVPVVVMARCREHLEELEAQGVKTAVLAPLEAGLEMIHQTLNVLKYDSLDIYQVIDGIRGDNYHLRTDPCLGKAAGLRFQWFDNQAQHAGTLKDLSVRAKTGSSIVAVLRDGVLHTDTGAEFSLEGNDRIGIVGSESDRNNFAAWVGESK